MLLLLAALAFADDVVEAPPFDAYQLVILEKGPKWTAEVTPEVEALQAQHLAHLTAMAKAGKLKVAGPLSDQADKDQRGICVYQAASLDEARELASGDPAVKAGRLSVDVMTWWTEKGALAFPGADRLTQGEGHGEGHGEAHGHGAHAAHAAHAAPHGGDDATVTHRFDDPEKWSAVFDDPARDAWQKPAELVAALGIGKGQVVVDLGAGTGYLEPHLAEAVGKKGQVVAMDVEPALLLHLAERARREGLVNVEARLSPPDEAVLKPGEADLVVLLDVYHHISDRVAYFTALKAGVKPGGRLAVVDFVPDRELPVGPPPGHRIAPAQVEAELAEAGWALVASPEVLPHQYVRVFALAGG